MSTDEPIVMVSHSRVLPGKLAALRDYFGIGMPAVEAAKPQTLAQLAYLDDAGEELTIFHVFADAAGFATHLEGVEERAGRAYEFIESRRFEVFGTPTDAIRVSMQAAADRAGVPLVIHPDYGGGFLRLTAARG